MFPGALLLGFVLVFAWYVEPLVFGIESAGLFENPTVSVGMICRFVGSAMDSAQSVQDFVQAGWFLFTAFEWLVSLTRSRSPKSGVDHCVVRTIVIPTFVLSVPWLPVAISDFRCTWVASASTGQPAVLARTKSGHEAC